MRNLHVAAAQIHANGDMADVLARMERQVAAAAAVGADLILFSECVLPGYDYNYTAEQVREIAEPLDGDTPKAVSALAAKYGVSILAGFFERGGEDIYNGQLVARPDGSREAQRKHEITPTEREQMLMTAGPAEREVFTFNDVRCAIIICADGGIDGLHDLLRGDGLDYRLAPTGGGGRLDEMLHESDLATEEGRKAYADNRPRVFKTEAILGNDQCPYTGFTSANALGPINETCHQGHCMIVDNNRVMRAQIPGTIVLEHQQDQMIHAVLNFE